MGDQTDRILKEKILSAVESPLPELTRRAVELPAISNKALAVIGMRRAGKTSFLHQCRGDLMAQGRNPKNLVYFNFEDERLGGLAGAWNKRKPVVWSGYRKWLNLPDKGF